MAVWVIVNVEEWDPTHADAAHGADAAGRRLAHARHAELGLARIRQPRRLLALPQGVRRVRDPRRARDQRLRHRGLSADRAGGARAQLGVHRPRLHPAQHAEGGRTRRADIRKTTRGDRRRPASRRAAGSGRASPKPGRRPTSWRRTATTTSPTGCSTTSRSWLKTRSRPIVNVPYTQECNDVAMMLIQHHKASEYYDRAIDQFEQIYADAADSRARDGDRRASLHHGRAAPAEIFPPGLRDHPPEARRAVLDRRADPRTGTSPSVRALPEWTS